MYHDDIYDVTNPPWNPSPEQFEAYKKRDRELAAANVATLDGMGHYPRPIDTLHSREAFCAGFQACLEERAKWTRKFRVVSTEPVIAVPVTTFHGVQ